MICFSGFMVFISLSGLSALQPIRTAPTFDTNGKNFFFLGGSLCILGPKMQCRECSAFGTGSQLFSCAAQATRNAIRMDACLISRLERTKWKSKQEATDRRSRWRPPVAIYLFPYKYTLQRRFFPPCPFHAVWRVTADTASSISPLLATS